MWYPFVVHFEIALGGEQSVRNMEYSSKKGRIHYEIGKFFAKFANEHCEKKGIFKFKNGHIYSESWKRTEAQHDLCHSFTAHHIRKTTEILLPYANTRKYRLMADNIASEVCAGK